MGQEPDFFSFVRLGHPFRPLVEEWLAVLRGSERFARVREIAGKSAVHAEIKGVPAGDGWTADRFYWCYQYSDPADTVSPFRAFTVYFNARRERPETYEFPPPDAVTAHGARYSIFGGSYYESGEYPDSRAFWRLRRSHEDLYTNAPSAGSRRREFDLSAEGLDAFPAVATALSMRKLADAERLRLLAATGVDHLLLPRPLATGTEGAARLLGEGLGRPPIRLYAVAGAIPDAQLLAVRSYAPHMNAAMGRVLAPDFDPRHETVLSGEGARRDGPPGTAAVVRWTADEIELAVDSAAGGAVVVRRAWHAIWSVEMDGAPAGVRIANLTRLAVEVPPGPHRVRFYVSRRPFALGLVALSLGLVGLVVLAP